MKYAGVVVLTSLVICFSWSPESVAETGAGYAADPDRPLVYRYRDKLRRGLTNAATGWLELPYKTFSEVVFGERSPLERLFVGLTVGTVKTVERTAIGVFETATFFIPSYDPLIEPEFVSLSFQSVTGEKLGEEPRAGLHVGR